MPLCTKNPLRLQGRLYVSKDPKDMTELEKVHSGDMLSGGLYKQPGCISRHRVAIIIPFRDREEHLRLLLHHLIPILKRQLLEFRIYVVDLLFGVTFNRAMLMNIGYAEAIKEHDWQCFIFHDVDLLPEDDRNIYSCPEKPRHMSVAVDTMKYRLPYGSIFGGVCALSRSQMEAINGFSNRFFGWGGEDDDIYARIRAKGFSISRYPIKIARYTMIRHKKDTPNPQRYNIMKGGTARMHLDGLNDLKYHVLKVTRAKLYTRIIVDINQTEVMASAKKQVMQPQKSLASKIFGLDNA